MKMVTRHSLEFYVEKLRQKDYFSFARYGDGEWHAILGDTGENCDGHEYFEDMGEELLKSLFTPYYHATIPAVGREIGWPKVRRYLNGIGFPNKIWHDGNVFRDACVDGKLKPLVKVLKERPFLYVGPRFLASFCMFNLGVDGYIVVPDKNCYLTKSETIRQIKSEINYFKPEIVGFSASMATKVMIAELYPEYGDKLSMIDFGSVFDPFPNKGRRSRRYMKAMNKEQIFNLNFRE